MGLFGKKKEDKSTVPSELKTLNNIKEDAEKYEEVENKEKATLHYKRFIRTVEDTQSSIPENLKSQVSDMLVDVGSSLYKMGVRDRAIEAYEKAKELYVQNAKSWLYIGRDFVSRNRQLPYALLCLKEATKYDPDNGEGWMLLGDAYRLQGQNEKAVESYKKAAETQPGEVEYYNKILKIDFENVDALNNKLRLLKDNEKSKDELIEVYVMLGMIEKNMDYINDGLKLSPNNPQLMLQKAKILIDEGKNVNALEVVDALLSVDSENIDAQMLKDSLSEEFAGGQEKKEVTSEKERDIFGDFGFEKKEEVEFEEVKTEDQIEENKEVVQQPHIEELKSIETPTDEKPFEVPTQEMFEEEIPEEQKPTVEEIVEEPKPEEKIEEQVEIKEEVVEEKPPETEEKDLDQLDADSIKYMVTSAIENEKYEDVLNHVEKLVELDDNKENKILKAVVLYRTGSLDDADKIFMELMKTDMKNSVVLYHKAALMCIKGIEIATKNFLNTAVRFDANIKEKIKNDKIFQPYNDKDWFQNIIS